jgi:hypothetical protein
MTLRLIVFGSLLFVLTQALQATSKPPPLTLSSSSPIWAERPVVWEIERPPISQEW